MAAWPPLIGVSGGYAGIVCTAFFNLVLVILFDLWRLSRKN